MLQDLCDIMVTIIRHKDGHNSIESHSYWVFITFFFIVEHSDIASETPYYIAQLQNYCLTITPTALTHPLAFPQMDSNNQIPDPLALSIHSIPIHGTIDSTILIVTEHKFIFRFFNPDQSFSQSDQSGIDCMCMSWDPLY